MKFESLDAARIAKGHTPEEACAALKISRYTWDNWKRGKTEPSPAQKELAERYINNDKA